MTETFADDSLYVCRLTKEVVQAHALLAKAERRADDVRDLAAQRESLEAAARKAAAGAEAERRANAWHQGYYEQDENIYVRFPQTGDCASYAEYGCWHIEVITRDGCSSYVAVHANEYRGETIINELLDNQGYGIPPMTARRFELDASTSGSAIDDVTVECS